MSRQFSFGATPTVRMRRSKFNLSHGNKTSMSVGKLYPIDIQEVLPGDTFRFRQKQVCRLSTAFLRPVMDNVYMDIYHFFVPARIVYDDWERVFGNPSPSSYVKQDLAEVPTLVGANMVSPKTVADYMGLPVNTYLPGDSISVLPFRAFAEIYNEWFRNENIVDEVYVQKGEAQEYLNNNPWSATNYTGQLPFVGKRKDYFTSCLPSPQKGEAVKLPIVAQTFDLPVSAKTKQIPSTVFAPMEMVKSDGTTPSALSPLYLSSNGGVEIGQPTGASTTPVAPTNLWATLASGDIIMANVNDQRMAFALQKMLEADARYGTRYREYILGHFGVSNADSRLQVPEYLGGRRMPISVQSVAQTNTQEEDASGNIESPLASLGAFSHSVGGSGFSKSFTEHGFVITVACIRQLHTYQQGINKMWFRLKREHFYDPKFANLGEQPVFESELFCKFSEPSGASNYKIRENVFGYNEAWAEYRYKPSLITGEMRTGVDNSFDIYHFADYYANAPALTSEFIQERSTFFDRTVAAPSGNVDNFIVDFWFDITAYRVMPVYSIPGLIDHH